MLRYEVEPVDLLGLLTYLSGIYVGAPDVVRTQVYLTERQEQGLKRLAASSGRKQSELIREAIEGYLAEHEPKDWKEVVRRVSGMWADHDELDEILKENREGWEKRRKRLYGE